MTGYLRREVIPMKCKQLLSCCAGLALGGCVSSSVYRKAIADAASCRLLGVIGSSINYAQHERGSNRNI
ncbi:MAG: hypothetical protein A3J74_00870 [Elusimicrobia bacterium RIFCSPHIGHO2_02_FULL_57_9]|nr:MAG: hypothetical protein A3J74_00870 [Elusimicrobia bacterium RIFCSPHIGHO2_02_FULL_57_9]